MIMRQNEMVSAHTPNSSEPTGGERRPNKGVYQAPRLVVIGTAVELVQGYGGRAYIDGQGFNRDRR
jgi:hypothetical protein